jgi:hypothetical protein
VPRESVLEAIKVLSSPSTAATQCKYTNLNRIPAGRRSNALLMSQSLGKPNPKCVGCALESALCCALAAPSAITPHRDLIGVIVRVGRCYVCGTASICVSLDTKTCSLEFLVNKVLRAKLGFHQPNVSFGAKELCGADPDDFGGAAQMEKNMQKLLSEWKIGAGAGLLIDDELTSLERRVYIEHAEFDEEENPDGFTFTSGGAAPAVSPNPLCTAAEAATEAAGGGTKRSAPGEEADTDGAEGGAKKARVA